MLYKVFSFFRAQGWIFLSLIAIFCEFTTDAQTNTAVRIMSANINGDSQSYEPFALRIFRGLKPDVVCIQEFNYTSTNGLGVNTTAALREMVDAGFGTNFVYYREPFTANGDLPNGIISRYPIVASGSWTDNLVGNRGFAWAQIHLPGTNDLYAVSVHLLTSSAGNRAAEATQLKGLIQSNFPANAWVVLAGDFNCDSRSESAMTTFVTFLSDNPIPADNNGNSDTSQNRNHPHDYVLPSFSFTNTETASVFPSHSFPNGLVFDSTVYTPLMDVPPVQFGDSTNAQHMAVMKDFLVNASGSSTNAPSINTQPLSQTVPAGSNVLFSVTAAGASPLSYQWYFNTNTPLPGATANTLTITNAQLTNTGGYSVIITNSMGSVTSIVASLTVTNTGPSISTQPKNQATTVGSAATFSVSASGTAPLSYQWFFNTNNPISGATSNVFTVANAQLTNAGGYSVVIANPVGSVTSLVAMLTVDLPSSTATNLVISQIYGGGGNTGATYKNDFVELFNPTASAVSVTGWSVQYASATGTGWQAATLNGTMQPYHYYLVQLASGGVAGNALPAVDSTGGMNISAASGKVALVAGTTALSGSNPVGTSLVVDVVGYGAANAFEGTAPATGAPSSNNTTSTLRKNNGFTDANDNTNDFTTLAPPSPRNSTSFTNPPVTLSAAPTLVSPVYSTNIFSFTVTGSAGSNYAVQLSTNLDVSSWISVFTNAAPFTFTDSNANNFRQGFYRAMAVP